MLVGSLQTLPRRMAKKDFNTTWLGCFIVGPNELEFETPEIFDNAMNTIFTTQGVVYIAANVQRRRITFLSSSYFIFLNVWTDLHKP